MFLVKMSTSGLRFEPRYSMFSKLGGTVIGAPALLRMKRKASTARATSRKSTSTTMPAYPWALTGLGGTTGGTAQAYSYRTTELPGHPIMCSSSSPHRK